MRNRSEHRSFNPTRSSRKLQRRTHRRKLRYDSLEDRRMLAVLMVQNDLDDSLPNLAGDGELSLREAIQLANNPGLVIDGFTSNDVDDTITFDAGMANDTITLSGTDLSITQSLTIQGLGADQLTISGNDASGILDFTGSQNYVVNDITLTSADGIAVRSIGTTLDLDGVVISNTTGTGSFAILADNGTTLNVTNSAIINNNNSTFEQILIANGSLASFTNTTISGNSGSDAIISVSSFSAPATLNLTNVTLAGNTGNGISTSGGQTSTVTYQNSILADNTGSNFANFGGNPNLISVGNNILDDATGDVTPGPMDQTNTDPLLMPLVADMGTFVQPLSPGSLAIDAANTAAAPTEDQRGVARFDGDGNTFAEADIGAYEFVVTATASLTVQNTLDDTLANLAGDNELSLREAIELANNPGLIIDGFTSPNDPIDVIDFDPGLAGSIITLSAGGLQVNGSATIQGLGADQLTINGGGGTIFGLDGANADKTFTITDLTLTGAVNTVNMSGSNLNDVLNIQRVVATGNADPDPSGSVMVASFGTVFVTDSAIVNNAHNGHAFDLSQGSATFTNVTISGNAGNAISTFPGTGLVNSLSLLNVTIADNGGAGVEVRSVPATTILTIEYQNSIFAENQDGNFTTGTVDGTLNLNSLGNNILDDDSDPNPLGSDLQNTDPLLLPLIEDAGTFVHPLRFDSQAIDAANDVAAPADRSTRCGPCRDRRHWCLRIRAAGAHRRCGP